MVYEQFEKKLFNDLNWRKVEFTELSFMLEDKVSEFRKKIILKACIALLYAHWEGHIKYCAMQYLDYINTQKISCKNLNDNFKQIYTGVCFNNSNHNFQKIKTQKLLFDFFSSNDDIFKVKTERTVETKANLKYETIQNILMQLDFPIDLFENEKAFIDDQLVAGRNAICHGDLNSSYKHDFQVIYNTIKEKLLNMIQLFHDTTLDYACNKKYLKI